MCVKSEYEVNPLLKVFMFLFNSVFWVRYQLQYCNCWSLMMIE